METTGGYDKLRKKCPVSGSELWISVADSTPSQAAEKSNISP